MKDSDGKLKYIPKESYNFTFVSFLDEHTSGLVEPAKDMDGATLPIETPALALGRFRSYKKKCDF